MRTFIVVTVLILGACVIGACNSSQPNTSVNHPTVQAAKPPATVQADGAKRITTSELQALLDKGQAVVIDVRNQASYDQGHIKGARLIPSSEIADRSGELPKDKTIVTYCS